MANKTPPSHKKSIRLDLIAHEGEHSQHVLNLRTRQKNAQREAELTPKTQTPLSFEERLAAFDERVKDVPDLLRNHAEHFSGILDRQKTAWQDGISEFFQKAGAFGLDVQKKLGQTARRAKQSINKKRPLVLHPRAFIPAWRLPLFLRHTEIGLLVGLLILFTIPLQGLLIYRGVAKGRDNLYVNAAGLREHGNDLIQALVARDFDSAYTELTKTRTHLQSIRKTLTLFGPVRVLLPERLRAGYATLELLEIAASSSEHLLQKFLAVSHNSGSVGLLLKDAQTEVGLVAKQLQARLKNPRLNLVLTPLHDQLKNLADGLTAAAYFSGTEEPRRVLLVFENPREMRATGGFLGSLALLSITDGKLTAIDVPQGGSYDVQGQLTLRRASPQPLWLINPRFELQDANWWPDFPTSAQKIAELYEATGGSTLDGVIAITARVGERLLQKTGPLKTAGLELTAENFIDVLQNSILADREQNRKAPKKIIGQLLPDFAEHAWQFARQNPSDAIALISETIAQKDIQLWSRDESVQAALSRLNLAGKLSETSGDYLSVITANVGGGKTDGLITEDIEHRAHLNPKATRTSVTITRTHHGQKNDRLTGHPNISYVRVYVPRGARLISAQGFNRPPAHRFEQPDSSLEPDPQVRAQEVALKIDPTSGVQIWEENGKTVFGHWLTVKPNERVTGELVFEVPRARKVSDPKNRSYTLTFDPQAGKSANLKSAVTFDPELQLFQGEGWGNWTPSGWNFEGALDKTVFASGMLYQL